MAYIVVQELLSKHAASLLQQQQQQQQQQPQQQSALIATYQSSSSSGTTGSSSRISIHLNVGDGESEAQGVALREVGKQSDLIMTTPDRHTTTAPSHLPASSGNSGSVNRLATPIRTPVPFSFTSHNLRVIGPSHISITQHQQQLHQYTSTTASSSSSTSSSSSAHSSHPAASSSTDLNPLRNQNPPLASDTETIVKHTQKGIVIVDLRDEDDLALSATHVKTDTAPVMPPAEINDSTSNEMHIAQSHSHHDGDDINNSPTGSEGDDQGDEDNGDGESVGKSRKRSYSNVDGSFPAPSFTSNERTSQLPNKRISARLTSRTAPDEQPQQGGQGGQEQQSDEDDDDNNDNNNNHPNNNSSNAQSSSSSSGRDAKRSKEPLTPTRFLSNHGRKFKSDDHVPPRIGSAYQADLPPLDTYCDAPTTTTHNHTISSSSSSSAMAVDTSALDLEVPKADPEKDGMVWDPSRLGRSADRLIGTYLLAAEECINELRNEICNHSTTSNNCNTTSNTSSSSSNSSSNGANSNNGTVGHMFSTGSSLLVTRTATEDVLLKLLHDRYTTLY